MTDAPGFFGKLPARGDFLSRRVPPGAQPQWERWLQALVIGARDAAPENFQDTWLTAPLWKFMLSAEIAPPFGAVGVMIASADRVGRLFPFSIIAAAAEGPAAGAATLAAWLEEAEALLLRSLDDAFDPGDLDRDLATLGPPALPDGIGGPNAVERLTEMPVLHGISPGQTIWWCRGSDRVPPALVRCAGLPDAALAAAMIVGGEAFGPAPVRIEAE